MTRLWVGTLLVFCFVAAKADAEVIPNTKLDAIASQAAGKPVRVQCETTPAAWRDKIRFAYKQPLWSGYEIIGYSYVESGEVHLSPLVCLPLLDAVTDSAHAAGYKPLAYALSVLIHEAQHAKGIKSEREAECAAQAVLPGYFKSVGIPLKVTKFIKKGVKWVPTTVPNVEYARALQHARYMHSILPPEYQGC